MFLFENVECPVCKRRFEEGDDIVVCPECGTPHHRECYQLSGRCVNSGLHGSGYNFQKERKAKNERMRSSVTFAPPQTEQPTPPEGTPNPILLPLPQLQNEFATSTEAIEGRSVADIAVTVGPSAPRFVRVFKKQAESGKRLGWNWGAFFFGSLYFFYRKMHRIGISLISAMMAIIFASDFATMKLAPKAVAILQEAAQVASTRDMTAFNEKILEFQSASDFNKAVLVSYATLGVILIFRIVLALFADSAYKKQVFAVIDSAKDESAHITVFQNPVTESANLNKENMHQLFLARRGGVTVFAPFIAFTAAYIIISLF